MNAMQKTYKAIDFPPLTERQETLIESLKAVRPEEIDTSDMPECTGNGAPRYVRQTDVHAKIDDDTLAWLKEAGKDYLCRLNSVLRWARLNGCPVTLL
ncbi:MAG: BrnA antitoxin family protein [Treponema sp.]|nr:BrnA antitoxin family protein [Treponema sp.]